MGAVPLSKSNGSTFAALRHITPDKQPVSPISRPTSPDVKAIKPPKLSLVMPKPDTRGSSSPSPSTPSLSPSSPRISYAQAAGVFSVPTTPTTPSPATGVLADSHAMIGDTFLLHGAGSTMDMNGGWGTSTARHEPKKPNKQIPTIILHRPNGTSTIVNPSFSVLLNPPQMKVGGTGRKSIKPFDERGNKMLLSAFDARYPPKDFLKRVSTPTRVSLAPMWGLPQISLLPSNRSGQNKSKNITQPKKSGVPGK